jgi:hypothetical protein
VLELTGAPEHPEPDAALQRLGDAGMIVDDAAPGDGRFAFRHSH